MLRIVLHSLASTGGDENQSVNESVFSKSKQYWELQNFLLIYYVWAIKSFVGSCLMLQHKLQMMHTKPTSIAAFAHHYMRGWIPDNVCFNELLGMGVYGWKQY